MQLNYCVQKKAKASYFNMQLYKFGEKLNLMAVLWLRKKVARNTPVSPTYSTTKILYLFRSFGVLEFSNSCFGEMAWEKQCSFRGRKQIVTNIVHLNAITLYTPLL